MGKANAPNDGLFVPFVIQELPNLNNTCKLTLAQILAFKDCRKTNAELGEVLAISEKTIGGVLATLKRAGLLTTGRRDGVRLLVANVSSSGRGSWLPGEAVAALELSSTDKVLLANIYSLGNCKKGCLASNFHLARVAGVTVQRVKDILTKLRSLGWIADNWKDGKRCLTIAQGLNPLPEKKTCTAQKQDALHSNQNKEKRILAKAENDLLSIDKKIEAVIQKTGWLNTQVKQSGLNAATITADLLQSGFVFVSENAARTYLKDFLGRKSSAAASREHQHAAAIIERCKDFWGAAPSHSQLAKLCALADKYGVHPVRYSINLLGISGDAFKFNAAAVFADLQTRHK